MGFQVTFDIKRWHRGPHSFPRRNQRLLYWNEDEKKLYVTVLTNLVFFTKVACYFEKYRC